jgi:hypothetical protein
MMAEHLREHCPGVVRLVGECLWRGSRIIAGRLALGEGGADIETEDGQDGKYPLSPAEWWASVFGHFPGR